MRTDACSYCRTRRCVYCPVDKVRTKKHAKYFDLDLDAPPSIEDGDSETDEPVSDGNILDVRWTGRPSASLT
jgi:hypothetical protein